MKGPGGPICERTRIIRELYAKNPKITPKEVIEEVHKKLPKEKKQLIYVTMGETRKKLGIPSSGRGRPPKNKNIEDVQGYLLKGLTELSLPSAVKTLKDLMLADGTIKEVTVSADGKYTVRRVTEEQLSC